jgi:hypothetical protein
VIRGAGNNLIASAGVSEQQADGIPASIAFHESGQQWCAGALKLVSLGIDLDSNPVTGLSMILDEFDRLAPSHHAVDHGSRKLALADRLLFKFGFARCVQVRPKEWPPRVGLVDGSLGVHAEVEDIDEIL